MNRDELQQFLRRRPIVLAPMEDVTDEVFRRICRARGAELCFTEFVRAEALVRGNRSANRRVRLPADDQPTAIQIYGSDEAALAEAAEVALAAGPAFVDLNCGCWVPKLARRGAGAGWLRDPERMAAMARRVVDRVSLPVTVKTRIGWGNEAEAPIVDLARRLEDAGVAAITIHCRVAVVGHRGDADWSWARRVREVVSIPVVVNGDVRTAADAARAFAETGCDAVMIGRGAIDHPWVFREARALVETGRAIAGPTVAERLELVRQQLSQSVVARGERWGVAVTRRHLQGYLREVPDGVALRLRLMAEPTLAGCLAVLAAHSRSLVGDEATPLSA